MGGHRTRRIGLFHISMPLIAVIAIAGVLAPDALTVAASAFTGTAFESIDWFFIASTTGLLVVAFALGLSRHGNVVLGRSGEKPEFSTTSWLSMLFAAGMGVGILFWGAAEPVLHLTGAPGADPGTPAAARRAIAIAGFHWGLHAWGVYCTAGLVLAYFSFRRKRPYLPGEPIRNVFTGRWASPVAGLADLIAVLAIVFGVAGSITFGVMQLQSGLHVVFGVDQSSFTVSVAILITLFVAYMSSAATGLDKGIKWLSNINMGLAILLAVLLLIVGPTAYLLKGFVTAIGDYASNLVPLSFRLYPYAENQQWVRDWTLTYFIWWIAWAPFVGVFIARISRGRTIREFVFGVTCVPAIFSLLWFAIFGGAGLYEELRGGGGIAEIVNEDVTFALFALFNRFPLSGLLSLVTVVLLFIFLVTSVDSATFVLGMLTSRGSTDPPRARKLAWGISLGLLGGGLMMAGKIEAVRSVAILGAIPFVFILLLQVVALVRALSHDGKGVER